MLEHIAQFLDKTSLLMFACCSHQIAKSLFYITRKTLESCTKSQEVYLQLCIKYDYVDIVQNIQKEWPQLSCLPSMFCSIGRNCSTRLWDRLDFTQSTFCAIYSDNVSKVQAIIESGYACTDFIDPFSYVDSATNNLSVFMCFSIAVRAAKLMVVDYLLQYYYPKNDLISIIFMYACRQGSVEYVKYLEDKFGWLCGISELKEATENANTPVMEYLVDENHLDYCLTISLKLLNESGVEVCIQKGARVSQSIFTDLICLKYVRTALMCVSDLATIVVDQRMIREIIVLGHFEIFASTFHRLKNYTGYMLDTCAKHGRLEMMKSVVGIGGDLKQEFCSPMRYAALAGHYDIVKYCVEQGCNPNVLHHCALYSSAFRQNHKLTKYLMQFTTIETRKQVHKLSRDVHNVNANYLLEDAVNTAM